MKTRHRPARHCQVETSRRGHLAGDQHVNLAAVIFIIGKAFIDLGARDVRETATDNGIHRFPALEQADDVVDSDACAFNDGMAATDTWHACDVAVTDIC